METLSASLISHYYRSVDQHIDRIALSSGERTLTYREFDRMTTLWAHHLKQSVSEKSRGHVAILTTDRWKGILAVVASFKAGLTIVPLDPAIPLNRLQIMMSRAQPDLVAADAENLPLAENLQRQVGNQAPRVILGDEIEKYGADESGRERSRMTGHTDPQARCYVFFTSGSTGQPKAIVGRLSGITHFALWEGKEFGVTPDDRVSQLTTLSFDAVLRDIFTPLLAGACICIPTTLDLVAVPERFAAWMESEKITLLHCVPSVYRQLLKVTLTAARFPQLRHVLMAGEALYPADIQPWLNVFGSRIQLVNLYGPSETTMVKLFHRIGAADLERTSIPIGKPMEGAQVVILDERKKPCPRGVVGEIYLRTPHRSWGYLDDAEETAKVFVQNWTSQDPDDLLYKTGDLGRLLASGDLEFLGRKDRQVKIRGVRVELGEVESCIRRYPDVQDVHLLHQKGKPGEDDEMIAYLVLKPEGDTMAMGTYLLTWLPPSMIPSRLVRVESIPRGVTGKVNASALPSVEESTRARGEYVGPGTETEKALSRIFEEVVRRAEIGIDDNFFAVGGHSLIATQVILRVEEEFGVELTLADFLSTPTIRQLSACVDKRLVETVGQDDELLEMLENDQPH